MQINGFQKKTNQFCTSFKVTMTSAETGSRLTLEEIKTEKDLGVYFSSDLKWRTHCQQSAAKANSILGQLRQAFHAWNPQSFNSVFTAFFRPHLEYATSVWNPHRRADVNRKHPKESNQTGRPHQRPQLPRQARHPEPNNPRITQIKG